MSVWKIVGSGSVKTIVDGRPVHWPETLFVICNTLLLGWFNEIWFVKQQHWVGSHPLSSRYVPIQLGVEEITPFMKKEEKIKTNEWKEKEKI